MTDETSNSLYSQLFSNRSTPYFNAENSLTPSMPSTFSISDQSQNSSNLYGTIIAEPLSVQVRRPDNCFTSVAMPLATTDTVENIQIENIHAVDEKPLILIPYFVLSCVCPSFILFIVILSKYVLLNYSTKIYS